MDPPALRVLVVDDNRDLANSLAMLLKAWGHHAFVAHDGPGALAAALAHRPDVALLDLKLHHGMGGYEVARRLRARAETASALLVAVTGFAQEYDRQRCQEAGFDHFLLKPFDPEELGELLKHHAAFVSPRASGYLMPPNHIPTTDEPPQ